MKKGFTLIELLVVIAIIGMLSALLVPNFMSARERARDVQRKNDLKSLQKALELYRQDQTPFAFPTPNGGTNPSYLSVSGSQWTNAAGDIYMSRVPTDPQGNRYYYRINAATITYELYACIENKADNDANITCCPAGFGAAIGGSDCSSLTTSCPTTGVCYKITQP